MDCFNKRLLIKVFFISIAFFSLTPLYAAGYFQLHNLMSAAQKTIPANRIFNDTNLNLEDKEQGTGHVVNTQFSNDGGMAGCGVTSTLMQYMYQNAGTVDRSKNYIALNVFSQVMGFDPNAPFWGGAEGGLKGYLMGNYTDVAYPNTPYHRVIPSLYPAYLGLYNNGLNCGRWVEADFDRQNCLDRTTTTGISKFCPDVPVLSYSGQKVQAYVFDSCEDNNGWCRDDAAHLDINPAALNIPNNYYFQWKFIRNPYYTDPNAPASLKDIWLAWFSQASKYWSYVAILNAENGISHVQYNIGDPANPTWIDSHVLAGDNNVTWSSTSNNGQLWQIEPTNAITDSAPKDNPVYQLRYNDYLGYPANHGAIYQFNLLFNDGTLGKEVAGYSLFYQGGAPVKNGSQPQNMTVLNAPMGTGKITVTFTSLPDIVSLDATQANYLRPVVVSDQGYTWDADQCANLQCVFSNLPLATTYHVFAHYLDEPSNDLTLRKMNDITINSAAIQLTSTTKSKTYKLKSSDMNLSTLYSARVKVPLKFATTSKTAINGNLQALFIPDNNKNAAKHITAETQGCFLNTYVDTVKDPDHQIPDYIGNFTNCTVYYTVNQQKNFSTTATPPTAFFNLMLPAQVGFDTVNYALNTPYNTAISLVGYNPNSTKLPVATNAPLASYAVGTGSSRSLYFILDPESDAACLQNLDPAKGVSVTVGNTATFSLINAGIPIETMLAQPTNNITLQVNLTTTDFSCQAMPAIPLQNAQLKPGIDVVQVIKLVTVPKNAGPKPANKGILASSTGDNACFGVDDTLTFSSAGNAVLSVPYHTSTTAAKVDVNVPAGSYTITDKPIKVSGGVCQLVGTPTVAIKDNTYTPVTLNYHFTEQPGASCNAKVQVTANWPNGCSVQMTLSSTAPLSDVTLSWQKGNYDWTKAEVWGGEGALNIPNTPTGNVIWPLPSWVNGSGTVGMNVNNDGQPAICSAFTTNAIAIKCSGLAQ